MIRARTAVAAAASAGLVASGVVAGASTATAADRPARQDVFAAARATTAKYHDITKADGFGELKDAAGIACIDNPWVWKANPNGVFDDWNPRVTCP